VKGRKPVPFETVREAALVVRDGLRGLDMPVHAKTTGSRGIHVYVPIVRGPTQKDVWTFAKSFSASLAQLRPQLLTAEYKPSKRPEGRVLLDYNQNAWGRTLASIYSVRPHPLAAVSTPVTWEEIEKGFALEDFHLRNLPQRLANVGDLWEPVLPDKPGRVKLERYLQPS
jgi:bifunctional non-homologous end joining protein LigD